MPTTTIPLLFAMSLGLVACGTDFADPDREYGDPIPADAPQHPVVIHQPDTLGVVDTPYLDATGTPIGVSCATCHGPNPDEAFAADSGLPENIHGTVEITHGNLGCNMCHDPDDRTMLHLADGQLVAFGDTMTLCAQCHGVQYRDYSHGAHGGMTGHWDLRQGERTRNHCVDCHAPHAPAYESVRPVHPPRDRYLEPTATEVH